MLESIIEGTNRKMTLTIKVDVDGIMDLMPNDIVTYNDAEHVLRNLAFQVRPALHEGTFKIIESMRNTSWPATPNSLEAARYTGIAYMAVPAYLNDERGDREGDSAMCYKRTSDICMSIVDVIRSIGELPAEDDRIVIRVYKDEWVNGNILGVGEDCAIYWDYNDWDRSEVDNW